MSTVKNFATAAMLAASVAATKAQQTLQKITTGTNQTTVELFQWRNGNSPATIVWSGWYNQDLSQWSGTEIMYSETTGLTYTNQSSWTIPLGNFPAEQIGNGTYEIATTPYTNNKSWKIYNRKNWSNQLPGGEFTVNTYDTDRDAIEDGNTNVDLLHSKWVLPHTFDNGTALPVGLHIVLLSRNGVMDTWPSHPSKRIGFRWNGSSRVQQTHSWLWNPYDNLQNATLWVDDVEHHKKQGVAYPNPTSDELRINDGDTQSGESFEYVIYDISGRQVGNGKAREDQPIRLGHNKSGMYFINTQDNDGDTTSHKIIKK